MSRVQALLLSVLAVCAVSLPSAAAAPHDATAARTARAAATRSRLQERWIDLITEYTSEVMAAAEDERPQWFRQPVPLNLNLPIAGKGGHTSNLPLLVLPVPIPRESESKNTCNSQESNRAPSHQPSTQPLTNIRAPVVDSRSSIDKQIVVNGPTSAQQVNVPSHQQDNVPSHQQFNVPSHQQVNVPSHQQVNVPSQQQVYVPSHQQDNVPSHQQVNVPSQQQVYVPSHQQDDVPSHQQFNVPSHQQVNVPSHQQVNVPSHQQINVPSPQQINYPSVQTDVPVSSRDLVESFRKQAPSAPELPPALLADPLPPAPAGLLQSTRTVGSPNSPRFDRSLTIQAELTVHRSDYTEPYTAWYDARSGATRVDFHGGATSTYHMVMPDGLMQKVELLVDQSSGSTVRRCGVTSPQRPLEADSAHPVLPDLQLFNFAGYIQTNGIEAERWTLETRGAAGAAAGEVLTYRHEFVLTRQSDDAAIPIRYTVRVESSVLGADSDLYEHRYVSVTPQEHDPALFQIKLDESCDSRELLDGNNAQHAARLSPLKEFIMPQRDTRHDQNFDNFVKEFSRSYVDSAEEAVRKTLLVQNTRFISSCNRQGATFQTGVNFLTDRLDSELQGLLGVILENQEPGEDFPHDAASVARLQRDLPDEFDWRPKGAVTHVRYQASCSTCWAFAVTGAVEGALFVARGSTQPLSEQVLVDCGHKHGAHGCGGTWPSHAYDYIKEFGLPALEEYTPYADKVLQCRDSEVPPVTLISSHVNVTQNSVPTLKVAIKNHAPNVVIIDGMAKSFIFYKVGVLYDDRCGKSGKRLNHAVLAVGWGTSDGAPHFILKNSWSAAWGESGYIRVQGPANTCGVLSLPSYPRLEKSDIKKQG